jgi:chromosome segregation ATPase
VGLRYTIITAALIVSLASAAAQAPRGRDRGDWPCRQAKVGTIALASVWPGPAIDTAARDWRGDAELSALVTRVSERRTPLEEAQSAIADYAKRLTGEQKNAKLTALMAGIFERLNSERDAVISGLERYGHKQKDMAERVRSEIEALNAAQSEMAADQQKVADLSNRVQWDTRVFEDRRRALTYVCETPVLIEQRLGALARTIAAAMG